MKFKRNQQEGFTLIELMIVIGLLSLLLSIIFGFFNLNIRTFHAGVTAQEVQNEIRKSANFISSELRGSIGNPAISSTPPGINYKMAGEATSRNISLVGNNIQFTATDGSTRVIGSQTAALNFTLQNASTGSSLILITVESVGPLNSSKNEADLPYRIETRVQPRN